MNVIELAILAEFIVFGPGAHQASGTLYDCPLIEGNPDFAPPFRVIVKTIERICKVDSCIYIENERRAVRIGWKLGDLTRHSRQPVR